MSLADISRNIFWDRPWRNCTAIWNWKHMRMNIFNARFKYHVNIINFFTVLLELLCSRKLDRQAVAHFVDRNCVKFPQSLENMCRLQLQPIKGIMHKKTFECSFNILLAFKHDAEKFNVLISLNCLKRCILSSPCKARASVQS